MLMIYGKDVKLILQANFCSKEKVLLIHRKCLFFFLFFKLWIVKLKFL